MNFLCQVAEIMTTLKLYATTKLTYYFKSPERLQAQSLNTKSILHMTKLRANLLLIASINLLNEQILQTSFLSHLTTKYQVWLLHFKLKFIQTIYFIMLLHLALQHLSRDFSYFSKLYQFKKSNQYPKVCNYKL